MRSKLTNPVFIIIAVLMIAVAIIIYSSTFLGNKYVVSSFPLKSVSNNTYGLITSAKGHFESQERELFPEQIIFQVDEIEIDKGVMKKYYSNADTACIGDIVINIDVVDNLSNKVITWKRVADLTPRCLKQIDSYEDNLAIHFVYDEPKEVRISETYKPAPQTNTALYIDPDLYNIYPFDYIKFEIEVSAVVHFFDKDISSIDVQVLPSTIEIDNNRTVAGNYYLSSESTYNGESVTYLLEFNHPLILRCFTGLLILFFLLMPLLITFVDTTGEAIEVAIAFFLGAWGFKQIIGPSEQISSGLIDLAFLGEYSLVMISLLLTVFTLARQKKIVINGDGDTLMQYFSLPTSKIFHTSLCSIIIRYPKSKLVNYEDIDHAKQAGKRPCKLCL